MPRALLAALLAWALAAAGQTPDPGTWILHIEGDAAGLVVAGARHKAFPYRAPRAAASDHRVSLVDAAGVVLAAAPLDLAAFCTDRDHRGDPPHVRGDVVLEHRIATTVKIPARDDAAEVRIEDVTDPERPVRLGSIDRDALLAALEKSAAGGKRGQGK